MTTSRRFAIFTPEGKHRLATFRVPEDGMCISTFLVIVSPSSPRSVLAGRIDTSFSNWDEIGAIDEARLERFSKGWMLPSSQIMMLESPDQAARRILKEQLGYDSKNETLSTKNPKVFSDVRETSNTSKQHWDIGFVFTDTVDYAPKKLDAWKELKFIDFDSTPKQDFVRAHDEVISLVL